MRFHFLAEQEGFVCIFAREWAKIKVATSVCTGGSNMPLAYCDLIIQIPLIF